MRRILAISVVVLAGGAAVFLGTGASHDTDDTYEVRAIFDNVSGAVPGEDVKVAGARVGSIKEMDVTAQNKAEVVLEIEEPGFSPFHDDAKCTIRPQSLIGEKFVECDPGSQDQPELENGELPIEQTSSPVDIDLINDVMRLPYRERLGLIINEFGTALAGRGEELNEVIHRANPALRETDEVLKILARQNRVLADLAKDSDTALGPLARERTHVAGFIARAGETAQASAERRGELSETFEKLPRFLEELKPTMEDLGALSDEMTPVVTDLGEAAPDLNRFILSLGPFSRQSVPSLDSLGEALDVGGPALDNTEPLLEDLTRFSKDADPLSKDLAALTTSFDETGGIERLMDYIFFQVTAINGYDSLSHYLRAGLIAAAACSRYASEVAFGCEATFGDAKVERSSASAARGGEIERRIAERPEQAESRGPIGGGIADRLKDLLGSEPPEAREQREANLDRLRNQVDRGPGGAEQPILDYLLGNDG